MQTMQPPPSTDNFTMFARPHRVYVQLAGGSDLTKEADFTASMWVGAEIFEFRPDREFKANYTIDLTIAAKFSTHKPLRASARIAGFEKVGLRLIGPNRLRVDIRHALSATKKCRLICFENGASSDGPCLTCPDGPYQIRICC